MAKAAPKDDKKDEKEKKPKEPKVPPKPFGVPYLAEKLGLKGTEVRRRLRKVLTKGADGGRYGWDTQEEADAIAEKIKSVSSKKKDEKGDEKKAPAKAKK